MSVLNSRACGDVVAAADQREDDDGDGAMVRMVRTIAAASAYDPLCAERRCACGGAWKADRTRYVHGAVTGDSQDALWGPRARDLTWESGSRELWGAAGGSQEKTDGGGESGSGRRIAL